MSRRDEALAELRDRAAPEVVTPEILVLSGLDPSGAAGLLRDVWAIEQCAARPIALTTCATLQDEHGLHEVLATPSDFVQRGLERYAESNAFSAVKIGLVPSLEFWRALAPWIERWRQAGVPVVVDPVRGASAGGLAHDDALGAALRDEIVPLGAVWTPNLPELDWLGGDARDLVARGAAAVLVKGGHAAGSAQDAAQSDEDAAEDAAEVASVVDVWHDADGARPIARARHPAPTRRGTGCTLASFLAVELALGREPLAAAREAGHRLWQCWTQLAEATPAR